MKKLADYEPVPDTARCLTQDRTDQIFHGSSDWSPEEEAHLYSCGWCRHNALWGTEDCLSGRQLIEFSLGREPDEREWDHLGVCPLCAYEYVWVKKEKANE